MPLWHQHLLPPGARIFWVFLRLASHQLGLCSRDTSPERCQTMPPNRSPSHPHSLSLLCPALLSLYFILFTFTYWLAASGAGCISPQCRWKTHGDLKEHAQTVLTYPSAAGGCLSLPSAHILVGLESPSAPSDGSRNLDKRHMPLSGGCPWGKLPLLWKK